MAKILVTGVAGFIGSHTADLLLSSGHSVVGVDDLRTGNMKNISGAIKAGLDFRRFSILDSRRLNRLVRESKIDAIIHLAALVSVTESIQKPGLNFQLNLAGTQAIAEAARLNGVARLVFASSAAVYGNTTSVPIAENTELRPISPYGAAKLASEYMLLSYASSYGITVRIQRYFNVFGQRQDPDSPYSGVISIFVRKFCNGETITINGDGRQKRDFICVSDVARANQLAATRSGIKTGIANICTGRGTSLLELFHELSGIGLLKPPCFGPTRCGDIRYSIGLAATAQRTLRFKARISVADGLRDLVSSMGTQQPAR